MTIAWFFPGQGAQKVGMGRDIADASDAARAVYECADAALGESLSGLCFDGPADSLQLTANTQPALVATSAAIVAALRERYPDMPAPSCAAGHSLGEYSALCAAAALSLEDAVRVARARGAAMQAAVPAGEGGMAAIMKVDDAVLEGICAQISQGADGKLVSPANYNSPGQTVIAGHAAAVEEACAVVKEQGGRAIPLKVSAPFHCALMAPARDGLAAALATASLSAPAFDVLANVDAEPRAEPQGIREALLQQVDHPVQWVETIRRARARGVTHALEIGPGKVIAGLVKRIDKGLKVLSINSVDSLAQVGEFLKAAEEANV